MKGWGRCAAAPYYHAAIIGSYRNYLPWPPDRARRTAAGSQAQAQTLNPARPWLLRRSVGGAAPSLLALPSYRRKTTNIREHAQNWPTLAEAAAARPGAGWGAIHEGRLIWETIMTRRGVITCALCRWR